VTHTPGKNIGEEQKKGLPSATQVALSVQPLATLEGDNKGSKDTTPAKIHLATPRWMATLQVPRMLKQAPRKKQNKKKAGKKKGLQRSDRVPVK
jgi:hypothetical protein